MTYRSTALALALAAVCAALLVAAANGAPGRTVTLRFYDKPVTLKLTHADGSVVTKEPMPQPKPGDTLDVVSVDYAGTHAHHAARWTASTHLQCVFKAGPPTCVSHVALGDSMLVFTGNPGTLSLGTGIYEGATGKVISSKELANNASDVVAKIQLRN